MTCSTCGRENPPHLTFCQECGQRLGPRIAPPTPPIGLGGQDAYGPPPNVQPAPRAATALGIANSAPDHTPAAPPVAAAAPATGAERRCKICDTANGPNLRYCTSCGSTLEPAPVALASAPAAVVAAPPAGAVPVSPANAIVPTGVVNLASGAAAPADTTRTCSRCKGTADGSAQFCKFCGNPLGSEPAREPAPQPAAAGPAAERLELPRPNGAGDAAQPALARPPTAPIAQVASQVLAAMRPMPAQPAPAPSPSPIGPIAPGASAAPAATAEERSSSYGAPPQPSGAAALAASQPAPMPTPAPAPAPARPAASPQRGRLVVIAKSGADGPSYPFGDLLDIGRTDGNVVVSEDPYLSPRHVRIVWNNGKLLLRDLGSTNGVYLRLAAWRDMGARRAGDSPEIAVPLSDQDLILVGQQVLRFDILKEGEGGFGPAQEHGTLLFGSPAAPRYARLSQRTVEGIARDVYYVRKVETVLGRESGDVVFTEDPFLSRRHAAIRLLARDGSPPAASRPLPPTEARFALVDLGSSNGTFLRIRSDVELAPGDHFRVGQQLFRVDFDGARG